MAAITGFSLFLKNALKYGFSLFGTAKTGQIVKAYDYDDGYYQKGYPKSGVRFVDNGDGTITDNASGLMWVQDSTGAGCNFGVKKAVTQALPWVHSLNFAGHTDWRLPNIKELMTILDYGKSSPAIDPIFLNTFSDYYQSSTRHPAYVDNFMVATFSFGYSGYVGNSDGRYIRPVRLG